MAPSAVVSPNLLTDPGYLFIAPLLSTKPTNTVAGSAFTDAWPAAWLPLGATEDGNELTYASEVEPLEVAEFFDPIAYRTTSRSGSVAFALANVGLTNFRRLLNGGVTALAATSGTGATALYTVQPPVPGSEVRCMLGWESQDSTLRWVADQCLQGGEVVLGAHKAPTLGTLAGTFQMEVPSGLTIPFTLWGAGASRA